MNIGNFEIGAGKTFIIAECCSNIIPHLYNLGGVVAAVASTGATALKIQMYRADHFPEAEQASKKRTEFPRDLFPQLVKLCHDKGLLCGASVFDEGAVKIVEENGGDFLKLATREWDNDELYDRCSGSKLPNLWSYNCEGKENLYHEYKEELDTSGKSTHIIFIACVPQYPAGNIKIPNDLTYEGWSSHTNHWLDCLIAVSRGAIVVEKHIGFSKDDYEMGWSLYPNEFEQMVKDIRWVEEAR